MAKNSFPLGITEFLLNKDLQHTPLYFYVLNLWMKVFSSSDLSIKMLSLAFAMGSLPLIYEVTKKITTDKIALIALVLMSVNACVVLYSTEARMYSMLMFLVLLSINYLVDFDKTKSKAALIKLSVVNILIPYTLVGAISFVAAQFTCYGAYLVLKKRDTKGFLKSILATLLALIPFFMITAHYAGIRSTFIASHVPDFAFQNVVEILRNFLTTNLGTIYWAGYSPYLITFFFLLAVIIPLAYMICAIGKTVFSKEDPDLIKVIFAICLMVFAFNTLFAIQKTIVLAPRYLIYILPLLLIITACGLAKLKNWHLILFITYFSAFSIYDIYSNNASQIMKENSLFIPAKTIQSISKEYQMDSQDLIVRPFGSSVFDRYVDWQDAPRIWGFELLQQYRRPNNPNFYTKEQATGFQEDFYTTLQQIVLSDDYISPNFYKYIKGNINDKVAKSRFVILNLYAQDIAATIPKQVMLERFASLDNIKLYSNDALFAKFSVDLNAILLEDFNMVKVLNSPDNQYIIFQKK